MAGVAPGYDEVLEGRVIRMSDLETRVKELEDNVRALTERANALEARERKRKAETESKEWPAMGRSYEPI